MQTPRSARHFLAGLNIPTGEGDEVEEVEDPPGSLNRAANFVAFARANNAISRAVSKTGESYRGARRRAFRPGGATRRVTH